MRLKNLPRCIDCDGKLSGYHRCVVRCRKCAGAQTSLRMKGKLPSNLDVLNANKKGSGNPMFGKHPSAAVLAKRAVALKESWALAVKRREKWRISFRGANNPRWAGGTTTLNAKIRGSIEYKLWREAVFKRDSWTCRNCGGKGPLHADHIRPFAWFPELRFAIDNGRTLCIGCHKKTPTYLNSWLSRAKCEELFIKGKL